MLDESEILFHLVVFKLDRGPQEAVERIGDRRTVYKGGPHSLYMFTYGPSIVLEELSKAMIFLGLPKRSDKLSSGIE